jgi:hypothetical protein
MRNGALFIAKHTKVDMIWVAGRSPTLVSYIAKQAKVGI